MESRPFWICVPHDGSGGRTPSPTLPLRLSLGAAIVDFHPQLSAGLDIRHAHALRVDAGCWV